MRRRKGKRQKPSVLNSSINLNAAVEKLMKLSPEFKMCWNKAQNMYRDQAVYLVFVDFPSNISDKLKENPKHDFRGVLLLAEKLIREGDEEVKTVICTFFIDSLLAESDRLPEVMMPILKQLGPESRAYALEWNKFSGANNPGLEE